MRLLNLLNKYRWLILTAAILKWMTFHAWVLHDWLGIDRTMAIWDSVITNLAISAFAAVLINVILHYTSPVGTFWSALASGFFLSTLCQWLIHQILLNIGSDNAAYLELLHTSIPFRWGFCFAVITGDSIATVFYFQLQEQKEVAKREATTATMVREAELQKLQLQLQPHFLFNCLNSINALIMVRPDEGRKMVQQLSDFLRTTIRRADEHWVTLEEEWKYLQLYLDIEKVRFGHRLNMETDFKEDTCSWKIPTLLLQPLVENAIKYGLYGTTGNVLITVRSSLQKNVLQISVSNPYDPDSQPAKGSGFGLSGIKRRLYLLFARNDLLQTNMENNHFTVTLKLPQAS